jgi:hypothetical protein
MKHLCIHLFLCAVLVFNFLSCFDGGSSSSPPSNNTTASDSTDPVTVDPDEPPTADPPISLSEGRAATSEDILFREIILGINKISLSWDGIDDYDCASLIISCTDGTSVFSKKADADTTNCTFKHLSPLTNYTLVVQAIDSARNVLFRYALDTTTVDSESEAVYLTAINTGRDLNAIKDSTANYSGNYLLMYDITIGAYYKVGGWVPIGNAANPFTGNFFGNGHVIRDLTISDSDTPYKGLFGYIREATIQNLSVIDCDITGRSYTGGLVGYNDSGTITDCHVTGSVTGDSYLGDSYTGGLAGYNNSGIIMNCHSTTLVEGEASVGGLVGVNTNKGKIAYCYATGSVISYGSNTNCGAMAGYNYNDATITDSYTTGSVDGYYSGGLVGNTNSGSIKNCYATGLVRGRSYSGALVGWNSCYIYNCYFDTATSGKNANEGVGSGNSSNMAGYTTAEMKTRGKYADSWDFVNIWAIDTDHNTINSGYPYLRNNPPAE